MSLAQQASLEAKQLTAVLVVQTQGKRELRQYLIGGVHIGRELVLCACLHT